MGYKANIRYVKYPLCQTSELIQNLCNNMTLEIQKPDVVQLYDSNLADSLFEVVGRRAACASPFLGDNGL